MAQSVNVVVNNLVGVVDGTSSTQSGGETVHRNIYSPSNDMRSGNQSRKASSSRQGGMQEKNLQAGGRELTPSQTITLGSEDSDMEF